MNYIFYFLLAGFLTLLKGSTGAFLNFNLALILPLIFLNRRFPAFYLALFAGIWGDLFSTGFFGKFTFAFLVIFFLVSFLEKEFISEPSYPILGGVIFLATLVFDLALFLGERIAPDLTLLWEGLATAILGILIYFWGKRWQIEKRIEFKV